MKRITLFEKYIKVLPEDRIQLLKNCMQDEEYHPEGDVFTHTKMVFDQVVKRHGPNDIVMLLSAIYHDVAKPETREEQEREREDGSKFIRVTHYEHEMLALDFIDENFHLAHDLIDTEILNRTSGLKKFIYKNFRSKRKAIYHDIKQEVRQIVKNHMRAHEFTGFKMKNRRKIREFTRHGLFNKIIAFSMCDSLGKG